ncbi:hypothetical protein OH77DRAFT_1435494 [Trametes cingulata]|nr:hypothetical protein OH77DRAFT_1435494 [Trametes cingulata]
MSKTAAELKEEGNKLFKDGDLAGWDATDSAEVLDPVDPVYPSNLSAALYELADYAGTIDAVLRAWRKLGEKAPAKPDLVLRLSGRLARALCFAVRARTISQDVLRSREADIRALRRAAVTNLSKGSKSTAGEELLRWWREWDETEPDCDSFVLKSDNALAALSRLPPFCKPLDDAKENYGMGTDPIINLLEGWGSNSTDPDPLNLQELPDNVLSEVNFLFGGVGDGRHTFATISGLHDAYRRLPADKQRIFHTHLTMLDIHDGTIARDLCMLMLLDQLVNAPEAALRAEIIATLMYVFVAPVTPSYCYDRLQAIMRDLQRRLVAKPPDLPSWVYLSEEAIPAVLGTLQYWLAAEKSAQKMLANHTHQNPDSPRQQRDVVLERTRNVHLQWLRDDSAAERRKDFKDQVKRMTDETLVQMPFVPSGSPPAQARAFLDKHMDVVLDVLEKWDNNCGRRIVGFEEQWYERTKVFLPPQELRSRHPGFEAAWKQVKSRSGNMDTSTLRKVLDSIVSDWRANITLFNRQKGRGDRRGAKVDMNTLAWDIASTFFSEIADALQALRGRITVELICGDLTEELVKMRYQGHATRPSTFPRKYTRMWLSNVPDYTHGPMNMAISIVPNLQDHAQATVACNCLLNTGVWADDHEYFHTYTHLLPESVPQYLGCRIIRSRAIMEVLTLGARPLLRPRSELASRDALTSWLTRVLFNTMIPGRSREPPQNVRLPHNLVAFFQLLMHLHRVGYPAHWLADFIACVLSGRMTSDMAPYDDFWPIPVQDLDHRVPLRAVRTDPWLVEFENIIATGYYAIPFAIAQGLPSGFSRDPDDIQVWEAQLTATLPFSTTRNSFTGFASPYEPTSRLLFYRPSLVVPREVISKMRSIFEGRTSPPVGSFFILTAQDVLQYQSRVRFRLSRKRVERMKAEKWCMLVYRSDNENIATQPVPVSNWNPVPVDNL